MQPKQIWMLVFAGVLIVVAVVLIVRRLGPSEAERDPIASWVCDSCGNEAKAPLENVSEDCPKCAEGQLIQRVFYQCKKCGEVFEAYQTNWSPTAPRAQAETAEADRLSPLPAGVPRAESVLVRRPGEKWVWRDAKAGRTVARELACPKCGKGKYDDFERVLDPSKVKK